jgi:hypothetical protein
MQSGLSALVVALVCGQAPSASYQTANFVVNAPTSEVAQCIAEAAEACRKDFANRWLEKDLADWSFPCRIDVTVTIGGVGGSTDVRYWQGQVCEHNVSVRGPLDRIVKGPLPHELTHVLFAHYFGCPAPRWADEGGAILSEDEVQGDRQRKVFRTILAEKRQFSLRRLLGMRQYPTDVPSLYAQGHSISRFLVAAKSRKIFLAFVRDGLTRGWDEAAHERYGYDNVEQLERAWLAWVEAHPEPREPSSAARAKAQGAGQ